MNTNRSQAILLWLIAGAMIFVVGFLGKIIIVDAVVYDTPVDLDGALTNETGSIEFSVLEDAANLYDLELTDNLFTDNIEQPVNIWYDRNGDGEFSQKGVAESPVGELDSDVGRRLKTLNNAKATILISNGKWDEFNGEKEDIYLSDDNIVNEGDLRITSVSNIRAGIVYKGGTLSEAITAFNPATKEKQAHELEVGDVIEFDEGASDSESQYIVGEIIDEFSFKFVGNGSNVIGAQSTIMIRTDKENKSSNPLTEAPGTITANEEAVINMQTTKDMFENKLVQIEGCGSENPFIITDVQSNNITVLGPVDCSPKMFGSVVIMNFSDQASRSYVLGSETEQSFEALTYVEEGDGDYNTEIQQISNIKINGIDEEWNMETEEIYVDLVSPNSNEVNPLDIRLTEMDGDTVILGSVEVGTLGQNIHGLADWMIGAETYAPGVEIWIDTNQNRRLNKPPFVEEPEPVDPEPTDETEQEFDDEVLELPSDMRPMVQAAINARIIKGDGDSGTFSLNRSITRAEMAVMIDRAVELDESESSLSIFADFDTDWDSDDWFAESLIRIAGANIMTGREENGVKYFVPGGTVSRVEAFKALQLAGEIKGSLLCNNKTNAPFAEFDANAWWSDSVNCLYDLGIVKGSGSAENPNLEPSRDITRAEFAKVLVLIADL